MLYLRVAEHHSHRVTACILPAGGTSDSDFDEPARPAKKSAAAKRRKSQDAEDDLDLDGFDSDMDDEERRKLASMNELDREMYLFEREEKLQRERDRRQLMKQARKDYDEVSAGVVSR